MGRVIGTLLCVLLLVNAATARAERGERIEGVDDEDEILEPEGEIEEEVRSRPPPEARRRFREREREQRERVEREEREERPERPEPRRAASNRFDSTRYEYSIGFDSSSTSFGVWGQNAAVIGFWGNSWGLELIGGWTTGSDTASTSTQTSTTVVGGTNQTITVTHSGSRNPHAITLATVVKHRIFTNRWLQVYGGLVLGANLFLKRTRMSGSSTTTVPNTADPDDYSVSEVSLGTVTTEQSLQFMVGPKLGAEVFLKWFPHLAIGFSTAVVTKFGGRTTTTTDVASKAYNVVNGVEQAPSSHSTSVTVAEADPEITGTTFGLGGTVFNFTGNFTIRYVW